MKSLVCIAGLTALSLNMNAGTITFTGDANGQQVAAEGEYTFTTNTLVIQLTNNLMNPTSVGQAISGIDFSLAQGLTGTLVSAIGELIQVAKGGSVTLDGNANLDWLQLDGFYTTAFGSSGPDHKILGNPAASGRYSNANGSIAKNAPHNPFVRHRAILSYAIPGATDRSAIETFAFLFGTGAQRTGVTIDHRGEDPSAVPEPATLILLRGGFSTMYVLRRMRGSKAN